MDCADYQQSHTALSNLCVSKMNLDKQISALIDSGDIDKGYDGPRWVEYRKMLEEYSTITKQISLIKYKLSQHGKRNESNVR